MELINKYLILLMCLVSFIFFIGCSKKEFNTNIKGKFVFDRDINKIKDYRFCIIQNKKLKELKISIGFPRWSPDGTKILAYSKDLYIFNNNGDLEQKIPVNYRPSNVVWHPDGKSVIFSGYIKKNDMLNWYIVRYHLDNAKEEILYVFGNKTYSFHVLELEISPDGQRIVFKTEKTDAKNNYLYIINIDGTGLKKLYNLGNTVSWYPNSQYILFGTNTDKKGNKINNAWGRLYKMNVDSEKLETIEETIKHAYRGTKVSKDGKYLVYSKPTQEGGSQIMICPIGERTEDKEIPVTYPKFKNGAYTQDTHPDWYQK